MVPTNTEGLVPVSCVEAGRWQRSSAQFRRAGRAQYAAGRAERMEQVSESLNRVGMRYLAQSEVWKHIAARGRRMGVVSETGAMSDIYQQFEGIVDEYVKGQSIGPSRRTSAIDELYKTAWAEAPRARTLESLLSLPGRDS